MTSSSDTTTRALAPAATARPAVPMLRLLFGSGGVVTRGGVHSLEEGANAIGRDVSPSEGIRLDDRRASRVHAAVEVLPDGVWAVDLKSRNGTQRNGAPISRARLEDGDVLRIGDSLLLFRLDPPDPAPDGAVGGLVGVSTAMRALRRTIRAVGPTAATVLLLGESGTGKEVAARALHELSGRRGPFVAVNCSAIAESLAESELFGHVAGAFTGARGPHPGLFAAADGGTLFLDEIGDLGQALQPKLLRALEQRVVMPVGAVRPVSFDARIVAATHRDLSQGVEQGWFRGDLLARLSSIVVPLPALRERREDVLPLLWSALRPRPDQLLSPDLAEALLLHPWRYNVRELLAFATELAVTGADHPVLDRQLVAHRLEPGPPQRWGAVEADPGDERTAGRLLPDRGMPARPEVVALLTEHRGRVAEIARATGRSRMQVYRWIERYGLDLDSFRDA